MIVQYVIASFEPTRIPSLNITNIKEDGGDTSLQTSVLGTLEAEGLNKNAFVIADDANILANPGNYEIVESPGAASIWIDFENPPYTVVGTVVGQDTWVVGSQSTGGTWDVNNVTAINGSQDLRLNSVSGQIAAAIRPLVTNGANGYTLGWRFKKSALIAGAAEDIQVILDTNAVATHSWKVHVHGDGAVHISDLNNTDIVIPNVNVLDSAKAIFKVKVSAAGVLKLFFNGLLIFTGAIVAGTQGINYLRVQTAGVVTTTTTGGQIDDFVWGTEPTAIQRQESLLIIATPSSIDMNETSVLSVQLKDKDLVNVAAAVQVTFESTNGIIVPSVVTTNGGTGFNNEAIFYPGKNANVTKIKATAVGYIQLSPSATLTVKTPVDQSKQSFLQSADIKTDSITADKQSSKGDVTIPSKNVLYFVEKAYKIAEFDASLQNINSIAVDEFGNLYVNGFDGAGVSPVVKKISGQTGATLNTYTIPAGEENLANRFDGIVYDGAHIWVAGANHLLKLDLDMTLDTDYTIAADGNIQFVTSDGEFIWFQLKGGTDGDKDKIWKFNPLTGTTVTAINYRAGDTIDPGIPREIKQVAMDDQFMYIVGTGPDSDWDRMDRTSHALTHRNDGDQYGTFGGAIDNPSRYLHMAGGSAGGEDQMHLNDTAAIPPGVATNNAIDNFLYDLIFDGRNVWMITSPTSGARRYVRKIRFNPVGPTLDVIQSFDLGTAVDPTALACDGQYLYVAAFAATSKSITKIRVGK